MLNQMKKLMDLQEKIDLLKKINAEDETKPEIIRKNKVWIQIYKEQINSIKNETKIN